jgi:hypothetical protein
MVRMRFRETWGKVAGLLTDVLLLLLEELGDTLADLVVGELDIILGVTVLLHQGKVVIVGDVELARGCI